MTTTISGSSGIVFPDLTTMQTGQQAVKAWVNFNGTGTVAIRAAYNVASITDNGVGDYTLNFTTAMPDASYSASAQILENAARLFTVTSLITSGLRINCLNTSQTLLDNASIGVAVFR